MFRGTNALSLDSKGRMSIPAKYRERLTTLCAGSLIVTIDPTYQCLLIYPLPIWEDVEQRLNQLPSTDSAVRSLKFLLIGRAEDCEMDSQGRILLSTSLREFAKLEKKVALAGQGERFELWDQQLWQLRHQESLQSIRDNPDLLKSIEIRF